VFTRLFWLVVGAIAGFTGSVWLQRRIKQTVDRLTPEHVQADVKAAFQEGKVAMRDREAELRQRYSPNGRSKAHR
jgi:hypothetical protein